MMFHAGVAMLAALGYPLAEVFHPLFGGNIDTPSFIAFQQTPLQTFWPAVVCERAVELGMVFPQVCPGTSSLVPGTCKLSCTLPGRASRKCLSISADILAGRGPPGTLRDADSG